MFFVPQKVCKSVFRLTHKKKKLKIEIKFNKKEREKKSGNEHVSALLPIPL